MDDHKRQRDVLLFALKELVAECSDVIWDESFADEVGRASQTVAEMEALAMGEVNAPPSAQARGGRPCHVPAARLSAGLDRPNG